MIRKSRRWEGSFPVDRIGRWEYTFEAWTDVFGTWRDELRRKVNAGQQDLGGEMSEGALLLQAAAERAKGTDKRLIEQAQQRLLPGQISYIPEENQPLKDWVRSTPI